MNVMHFTNQKERLDFLKGNFEEIKPQVATPEEIIPQVAEEEPKKVEEKPKKTKKTAKKSKKEDKNDEIQAE
ncbi:MAG: hypothetical protein U0L88_08240 [Acutalibacteraceae bacterium]|nr:hypothetical protein [Acutalibacteraceae bacterium]